MKRLLLAVSFSVALFANPWLKAEALSAEDLARANAHLNKTSAAFIASTKGLSEAR